MTKVPLIHRWLGWAGVLGALGVLIGAFGAHGMPEYLADAGLSDELILKRLDQFDVGVRYHLVHAVALLALAFQTPPHGRRMTFAMGLMAAGILLFSGSLYVLVITNTTWWGAVTPVGGLCWIAGWTLVAIEGFRDSDSDTDFSD